MKTPWILARRQLRAHWLRSALTMLALVVALFLFCFLVSLVTTLNSAAKSASANRLIVESAVSLFVTLPLDYQPKITAVPGAEDVTKFQWFGGIYQDPKNFFAQFGVDPKHFLDMYTRELVITEGPGGVTGPPARQAVIDAFAGERRAALIGAGLARDFGWKVGDTVPLEGTIFPKKDGTAWDFVVIGIYRPLKATMDDRTLFFDFTYLKEALEGGTTSGPIGVSLYAVNVTQGKDPAQVVADIDQLFENGPQVTLTATEAAWQAGFAAMNGNLPFFVATIGGAVVFAVFFSVVNTMFMSSRQRMHETGILKALGFSDGALARLMLGESLVLTLVGGGAGCLLAAASAPVVAIALGAQLPGFSIEPTTLGLGMLVSLVIGLTAGIGPAIVSARLAPTDALRSEG